MGSEIRDDPQEERRRRDAAFAELERATLRAGLALTPVQRLEWLQEMIDLAASAGVLSRPQPHSEPDPPAADPGPKSDP